MTIVEGESDCHTLWQHGIPAIGVPGAATRALNLDRSATSRRVATAIHRGYVKNLEDRKGRSARLVVGDPMPEEIDVLPAPEALSAALLHRCGVDAGETSPPRATSLG